LCGSLYIIDQDVGVRSKTGNSTNHVASNLKWTLRVSWLDC
jgi:hypothetical protein